MELEVTVTNQNIGIFCYVDNEAITQAASSNGKPGVDNGYLLQIS